MMQQKLKMGKLGKNTGECKVYDKAGDTIFVAYKNDNSQIITGYFTLVDDLNQQINFLRIRTGRNVLMIPHSQVLKIKLKGEDNGD